MSYIGTQPVPQSLESRQEFTATASQTTFATSGYTVGYVDVTLNGVKLSTSDFTATNGSDIVLGSGAAAGDVLAVVMKNDHSDLVALPITDSAGNNILSESGGTITLTTNSAVIEGSSSGNLVRITQTGTGNALVVEDSANPDSTPFVVDSIGNVGIGTSSPSALVHTTGGGVGFKHTNGSITLQLYSDSTNVAVIGDGPLFLGTNNANPVLFKINDTIRMQIDSSGNVGIGTSPSAPLDVKAGTDQRFMVRELGTGAVVLDAVNAANSAYQTLITNGSEHILRTGATERMRIDSSGAVTISNLGSGDVVATNGVLSISSDIRLKNYIGDIDESGIETIKQLTPRYYSWKEDENNRKQLGFFAQEVFPILPEAVPRDLKYEQNGVDENGEPILEQVLDENGEPDYQWGFATQPIVAMLVKAIQEQQTLIESQQSQLDALTVKTQEQDFTIASLISRIEALENP